MSDGGVKRPAVVGPEEDRSRSQQQRPRLEASASTDEVSDAAEVPAVDTDTPSSDAVISVELICNIAAYMNPGDGLMNLCVAVGPVDAAKVRTEYLRDNEQYVEASLRELRHISGDWSFFRGRLHLLDRCRDNISAWMRVNTDWQARCTDENMKRYLGWDLGLLRVEANLVFNNPAVAVEVGLLDVIRFHVEEKGADLNRSVWNSFRTENFYGNDSLIEIALVRGDVNILEFLLSVNTCIHDLQRNTFALIRFASVHSNEECFEAFIRHPRVNVNAVDNDGYTPLSHLLQPLSFSIMPPVGVMLSHMFALPSECLVRRILLLLEAGATSHGLLPLRDCTMIEFARSSLEQDPSNVHWRSVVQKMEEVIDSRVPE
mmetsp:Transcript_20776/g.42405  ORF Transcript_20776/g.42405 Transcript_20776/m.42405 type:complete len:374 (-) Transcript_20776:212-1333(-)